MFGFLKNIKNNLFNSSKASVEEPTAALPEDEAVVHGQYIADQPIAGRAEDRFNRAIFATRIAETIATRVDPSSIVLGLYGPWGDGKTSVLEMMQESLRSHPNAIIVRFNPWHFQNEDLLLRGFFATLAEAMGQSLPSLKEKAGELLKNYGSVLSLASLTIGGVVQVSPGETAKGFGEAMSNVGLDVLRDRIERMLDEAKKRLVILIDDIDRLDRDETHAVFKLVKLSASFRHTSYVLAFDDEVVSAALGERYGAGGAPAGRAFLEKIVQVPLHLPPADQVSLRSLTIEGVVAALNQADIELTQHQGEAFARRFDDVLLPKIETPHRAKLFSNALMFALPILKGEVNPVDLMLIEGIRVLYPNLYVAIRENPDLFLQGEPEGRRNAFDRGISRIDSILEGATPALSTEERAILKARLLEPLFPRVGNSIYGRDWEATWSADQKVCSGQYFKRYFTYSVPVGDVPDAQIAALCTVAPAASVAERRELLEGFSNMQGIPRLILRLRQTVDSLTPEEASALISTIVMNGDLLPRERGFLLADTRARGGMLVADLLRRQPDGDVRQAQAEQVIHTAAPIGFAVECMRWIRHQDDRPEERRVLTDAGDAVLRAILSSRIEEADSETPLFMSDPKDAPVMYFLWAHETSVDHVRGRLQAHFDASPEQVDNFLTGYVSEAWGMDSGLSQPGDLRRDQYDSVCHLVSAEYITHNLRSRYNIEPDLAQSDPSDTMPQSSRIAHQFMWLHRAVLAEQQAAAPAETGETDTEDQG